MKETLVEVGYTKKTHGTAGELKVIIEEDYLKDFLAASVIFVEVSGKPLPHFVENLRPGKELILKLEGVNTVNAAMLLTSKTVSLREKELKHYSPPVAKPASETFEYLTGFELFDESKGLVGVVEEVVEYPHQWLAVVKNGEKEWMIPLHESLIAKVKSKEKQVVMRLPEGILDL